MTARTKTLLSSFLICLSLSASAIEITGAGSSAANPLYSKWADAHIKTVGIKVSYEAIGSSGGIKKIKADSVDFGASDVAMSQEDLNKFKLINFPTAISGVVPVVNLPGIKAGDLQLTGEVLANIYSNKVLRWNDPAIAALNPGLNLPKIAIIAVARQDGSGTTYNLSDYLSRVSTDWNTTYGKNFTISWPAAISQVKGSSGVVDMVKATSGAIGYLDYNYVVQERLSYVQLRNRDGKFVAPNGDSFRSALNNSGWKSNGAFEEMLTNKPGADTWPITVGTFAILPQRAKNPTK
ncbi:MAG: phosphate ABC transporter substrate-binding protein PstS, partial [Pseudomonadota bacterium]